ncbi:MAG TPA: hypothetical protein VG733_17985, partial [Chthoniobacteraceae bacterium]|nr:hypothetical protein [Chthoniobacteraceae bacterium]
GRACMTVKIPCVLDNWIAKGPCYYIVYFSIRDGYFPAGWKLFSAGGRLLVDYQIDELGAANADKDGKAVFRYPKKATYRCYASDPQYPADKPQYVITTETKSFALNTVEDDSIFTIDPVKVKAGMLFDYDRNIATRLPAQP